jgi:hypothetical protein
MRKLIISGTLLSVLFTACSPKIATTVTRQQPALMENQKVTIYRDNEQVPDDYEMLGTISVGDAGFTTHCDSLRMITLVKEKSREIGGNAVLITEHKRPSFWGSSCHQFKGLVLNVPSIESIDDRNIKLEKAALSLSNQRLLPRFTFSGNIGPSWRTNKIASNVSDFQRDFYRKLRSGFQWNVSADYNLSDHSGIRMTYQSFYSSHSSPASMNNNNGNLKGHDLINAIYPAYVIRLFTPNQKWLFDYSLGFGYIHFTEKLSFSSETFIHSNYYTEITGSSVCFQSALGTEYRFSGNWGAGLGIFYTTGSLSKIKLNDNGKVETKNLDKGEYEGLNHFSVLLGLKYHIK